MRRGPRHLLPFACLVGALCVLHPASLTFAGPTGPKQEHPGEVTLTSGGLVDLCLGCHDERPGKAHGREVLGCALCHLGDPLAGDKIRAHRGMVLNPGELRVAEQTCGRSGCHPNQVGWVKNSLMATNRGIISTLRFYWGETEDHNEDLSVDRLLETGQSSPALDYFRKMCGSCHLWMERGALPYFLARKGGGCTACHLVEAEGQGPEASHPLIVRRIPTENCVRCHNRSGRIGLSFQGRLESEAYGTPYEGGDFSSLQLEDGRFYQLLDDDIHHRQGLICIDCHTQKEAMGDGSRHAHFEEQLEVTCRTCHGDAEALGRMAIADRARREGKAFPTAAGGLAAEPPRLQVVEETDAYFLKGKWDEKSHPLNAPDPVACGHPAHRRLSCQACHSTWVPQCYGCHVRMDPSKTQADKIANRVTPGLWDEFRSFLRYESPPLGVLEDEVVILVPG